MLVINSTASPGSASMERSMSSVGIILLMSKVAREPEVLKPARACGETASARSEGVNRLLCTYVANGLQARAPIRLRYACPWQGQQFSGQDSGTKGETSAGPEAVQERSAKSD